MTRKILGFLAILLALPLLAACQEFNIDGPRPQVSNFQATGKAVAPKQEGDLFLLLPIQETLNEQAKAQCALQAYDALKAQTRQPTLAKAQAAVASLPEEGRLDIKLAVTKKLLGRDDRACVVDRQLTAEDPWKFAFAGEMRDGKSALQATQLVIDEMQTFSKAVGGVMPLTFQEAKALYERQDSAAQLRIRLFLADQFRRDLK